MYSQEMNFYSLTNYERNLVLRYVKEGHHNYLIFNCNLKLISFRKKDKIKDK